MLIDRTKPVSKFNFLLRACALILLFLAPVFFGRFLQGVATEVLIFGIFAMSLDLLIGFTGLISFGHALFFAVGAYTVVILGVRFDLSPFVGIMAGIVLSIGVAAAVGYLCIRVSGIAFLMLTMAFSQLFYSMAIKWRSLTGGSDGVGGLDRPSIFGLDLEKPLVFYYCVLIVFLIVLWAMRRLINAPLGHALVGIRENDARMRSIGFPVQSYKLIAFIIAGGIAGLAGGLFAVYAGFVSADLVYWTRSGEVLIMTVLGGVGTLVGPALGAAIFIVAKIYISSFTDHWLLVIGLIFVLCVLFFKQGVYGKARAGWQRRFS
jgi:branched-chain amino acid transport system permease protein